MKLKTLEQFVNESIVTDSERKWIAFLKEYASLVKHDVAKFCKESNRLGYPNVAIQDAVASELGIGLDEAGIVVNKYISKDDVIGVWESNITFQDLYISKNKWIQMLKRGDRRSIVNALYVLIDNSYGPLGGHPSVRNIDDIFNSKVTYWEAADIDIDPDADTVIFGKKVKSGMKIAGMGHDGLKGARKELIEKMVLMLQKPGYWIEASGRLAEILYGKSVPYLDMEEDVEKVIGAVEWLDSKGEYIREVQSGLKNTETIFGRPLLR